MPFAVTDIESTGDHMWAAVSCSCDLADENDKLLGHTVAAIRTAYGEDALIKLAAPEPDPSVASRFNLDAIRRAFRRGLPDPTKEGDKPPQLTNYRSECAEMIAKGALSAAFGVAFPVAPQRGKTNANMPVLGFDHWGIVDCNDEQAFALVQVKGTEETAVPPTVAEVLASECKRIPNQPDEICRALSVLALALESTANDAILDAVLGMLEQLGNDQLPTLVVSPVVVRGGRTPAHVDDLGPCKIAALEFTPAIGRGASVSIGTQLAEFGNKVMTRARAA